MHERFRIHHGVGSSVLLDSNRDPIRFSYEQQPSGWLFTVCTDSTAVLEDVLRLKDELNVFIFREEDGNAVEKLWFYTGAGYVVYNEEEKCLRILATSHIVYKPDDFVR